MMDKILAFFDADKTPQSAPLFGTDQVKNSAGGYTWAVDDWARLDRFLILGAEGGSYYASARSLTVDNAKTVLQCLERDGPRVVARVVEISASGRAPKNDTAIFVLALALKKGDEATRKAARAAVPQVCRIGTHLFQLAASVDAFGGWGRGTKGAFSDWYAGMPADRLAYQAVKYQGREGWTGRDLLRKAHVKPPSGEHDAVFRWMTKGWEGELGEAPDTALRVIWATEMVKRAETKAEVVALIEAHDLVREVIPTRWLNEPEVWEALLMGGRGMPLTAMLRNLAKMTAVGLIAPNSVAARFVDARLSQGEHLRKARVHPLGVLVALNTYRGGRGIRGKLSWTPVSSVVNALDGAFYRAFGNVEVTGKRWALGLDVSGSMGCGQIAGMPGITPAVGTAAMAMVTAAVEKQTWISAFSTRLVDVDLSPKMRLDAVIKKLYGITMGGTDCALPMVQAKKRKIPVDVFVVYTDNETWHGKVHPAAALRAYREAMGIPAKLIVVGMVSNKFSIADPDDAGMLDIVGFDTAAPGLMAQFAK